MGSNKQLDEVIAIKYNQDKWEARYDNLQGRYDKLQDKYDEMEKCFKEQIKSQQDKFDQKDHKYNELFDKYDNLKQQIKQDSASYSSQSSSSLSKNSIAISNIKEGQARDILSALSFQGVCETKVETFLSNNHDHIEFKDIPLNWEGFENPKNTKLCIDKIVEQLKTIGIDLEDESRDFKIVDVSQKKGFFKCDFLEKIPNINGTCDAVIVPREITDEYSDSQLRVMFVFKTPKSFSSSVSGQIVGELIGGSYHSFHPSILIKTDLVENYEIWQIREKVIYKCKTTAEIAFKAIAYWMNNICSNSPIFNPRKDAFDESLTRAYFFFEEEFKVRIRDEICCLLREQLEVAEMADSDLSPFEKYLSTQQVFNNFFNI